MRADWRCQTRPISGESERHQRPISSTPAEVVIGRRRRGKSPARADSGGRLRPGAQDLIFENSDLAKPRSRIDDLPHLGDAARLDPNEQGLIDIDASTGRIDTEKRPVVDPGSSNPSSGCVPSRNDITNLVPQLFESLVRGAPRSDLTIDPDGLDAAG